MKNKLPLIAALAIAAIVAVLVINNTGDNDPSSGAPSAGNTTTEPGSGRSPRNGGTSNRNLNAALSNLDGQEKIDLVLADENISHEQAYRKLLAVTLDQQVAIEVRNDALEHALNLVTNSHFKAIYDILGTGKHELPAPLVQTILDDTMNRTEDIQLNTALLILQGSHKGLTEEAKELLEFHLDENHGNDLIRWNNAVLKYLEQES